MSVADSLYLIIGGYLFAAVATITLTGYVFLRHRKGATERAFGVMVGSIALMVIGFTARVFAVGRGAKLFWELVGYGGLVILPPAFLIFTLRFSGRNEWVSRRILVILSIHPVFTLITLATNPTHGLFYEGVYLTQVGDLSLLVWTAANAGPAFWVHVLYSYSVLVVSTVLLLRFAITSNRFYKGQTATLILGALIPLGVNLAVLSDSVPQYIDITPLGFALGVLVLAAGIFRFQLLDIVPIARRTLVESLDDAVFVLDPNDRIIDANRAGRTSPCLSPDIDNPVGEPFQSVLRDELKDHSAWNEGNAEYTLRVDGEQKFFWARNMPITGQNAQGTTLLTVTDITERRARERELQATKNRLESFIEASPVAIIAIDSEGNVTLWNSAAEEIFGWTEAEVLGEFNPVIPDENRAQHEDLRNRAFSGEELSQIEVKRRTKGGSPIDVTISTAPLFDADGELTETIAFLDDITERKEASRELRESEESLRELYRITSDTDRAFEAKLNRILELGREYLDLPFAFLTRIEGETQHIVEAVGSHELLQAGESGPLSEAYCRKTIQKSGLLGVRNAAEEGWESDPAYERFDLGCYLGGKIIVNENLYGTLCFAGDAAREHTFTESEQVFVELMVQWASYELERDFLEGKLRDLHETAGELLEAGSIDEIGEIAVESAEEILDLEVTGIWRYEEAEDALIPIAETKGARQLFGPSPRFEPGGSLTWEVFQQGEIAVFEDVSKVEGRYEPETDIQAEIIVPLGDQGVISTGSQSERTFSKTDIDLFELFASTVSSSMLRTEREQALRKTRAELERSNEDLEQFAYVASHDLQEPLRTVSNYLQLLEQRYEDELDEDAEEFLEFAVNGAERMHKMINALLEYSRVDTRGAAFSPTDLSTVYDTARQNLRLAVEESDAEIIVDELPTVLGDENQLVQLFQNLLDNAIKYAEDTEPRIHISANRSDDEWVISVEDNGIGMTPDETERVFQIFERLHGREAYSGTGIGLALSRKIVDRHGGDIWIESEQGEGATVYVTLPGADNE